jgi:hypothetical protein
MGGRYLGSATTSPLRRPSLRNVSIDWVAAWSMSMLTRMISSSEPRSLMSRWVSASASAGSATPSGATNAQPLAYSVDGSADDPAIRFLHGKIDLSAAISQAEKVSSARRAADRPSTSAMFRDYSHISQNYSIGTADTSVSAPILEFIHQLE